MRSTDLVRPSHTVEDSPQVLVEHAYMPNNQTGGLITGVVSRVHKDGSEALVEGWSMGSRTRILHTQTIHRRYTDTTHKVHMGSDWSIDILFYSQGDHNMP